MNTTTHPARRRDDIERTQAQEELACLTARQREVLELVCKGFTDKAICLRLGVSMYTVRDHRAAITRHLGCSTAEAIVTAAKAGWV